MDAGNERIELSAPEFKALSSETRTSIIKLLKDRNYTLTELSDKLSMSMPSVKEHMNLLTNSGLAELQDEGRKWKYYAITRKGKKLFETEKTNFFIVLSIASIAFIGLLLFAFFSLSPNLASASKSATGSELDAIRGLNVQEQSTSGVGAVPQNDELLNKNIIANNDLNSEKCAEVCGSCNPYTEQCNVECNACVLG
ncbi:MAG: winged helix-turn-helix domain-containing protein [Candidatus Diapherotrites archaeon]|nr:winged helix-turn-helix domain-containing protein [Candidatus Diapherotrites archaeon]